MTRVLLVVLCLVGAAIFTRVQAQAPEPPVDHAKRIFELLRNEQFDAVVREFDGQMTTGLPAPQLQQVWATLSQQVGRFTSILDEQVAMPAPGVTAVVLGCQFERAALNVIVSFDVERRINGLRLVPRPAPTPAAPAPAPPQGSNRFTEDAVTVGSGDWALPGMLTLPAGRALAAVVLVHGSGPGDRDETIGANAPFRDIAWGLANRGIAVLRYEKRTRQYAIRMSGMTHFTVREEAIDDALLAVKLLRARQEIDPARVFVLGHSLGGTLAPRIGADDQALAGIVILAGATRPLQDVMREQLMYLSSRAQGTINVEQALRTLQKAAPESYWADLDAYNPAQVAASLQTPMLILQGERDYQVTHEDFDGWRHALAGRATVTLKSYPALNHLFMTGEGKSAPEEYERPGHVADVVLDDIAAWIARL
jgi:dienelactone hydrolase